MLAAMVLPFGRTVGGPCVPVYSILPEKDVQRSWTSSGMQVHTNAQGDGQRQTFECLLFPKAVWLLLGPCHRRQSAWLCVPRWRRQIKTTREWLEEPNMEHSFGVFLPASVVAEACKSEWQSSVRSECIANLDQTIKQGLLFFDWKHTQTSFSSR